MPVPSSGELKLYGDIQTEIGGAQSDTSLHDMSIEAGFSTPDAMSDFYGYSSVVPPAVTTISSNYVYYNSMNVRGCVTDTGGGYTVASHYFGTNSSAPTNNTKFCSVGVPAGGTCLYNGARNGLNYQTTYYNWAYACNDAGEAFGSRNSTTTPAPPFSPTYHIGCNNAIARYSDINVPSAGGYNVAVRQYINPYTGGGVTYRTGAGGSLPDTQTVVNAKNREYIDSCYCCSSGYACIDNKICIYTGSCKKFCTSTGSGGRSYKFGAGKCTTNAPGYPQNYLCFRGITGCYQNNCTYQVTQSCMCAFAFPNSAGGLYSYMCYCSCCG